jgi:uncharacterized protein (DUF2267 family)
MDANQFLHQIETRTGLTRDQAYKVMLAALQELHDRLSPKEADDLGAQLAGEIKAMWFGLNAPGREVRRTHKKDFVRHIAEAAEISEVDASRALLAVFKALQMALASPTGREGEAWDVFSQLPKDLKQVWMAAASMGAVRTRKAAS